MAKGLPQRPGAGVSEKQGRLGGTYGSNHVDNRPDGGRADLFCQQRLHLLHFFVSRAVHRRWSPQGRHSIRVRFPSVATSGPGASDPPSFITRASCTRRRRRRCRQTQSRRSSPPSRSTMPSTPLSRSAHPSFPPVNRNLTTRQSSTGL